jgi:hypothetical protein
MTDPDRDGVTCDLCQVHATEAQAETMGWRRRRTDLCPRCDDVMDQFDAQQIHGEGLRWVAECLCYWREAGAHV